MSSQFLSSDQPSEPKSLDVVLETTRVENYARKTCGCGNTGDHSIPIWIKVALVTVEIVVLCGWWFSNQFDSVLETPDSCEKVDESVLCPETDWHIRFGKQGYMFILTDFSK